jgi:hypothetical protein
MSYEWMIQPDYTNSTAGYTAHGSSNHPPPETLTLTTHPQVVEHGNLDPEQRARLDRLLYRVHSSVFDNELVRPAAAWNYFQLSRPFYVLSPTDWERVAQWILDTEDMARLYQFGQWVSGYHYLSDRSEKNV